MADDIVIAGGGWIGVATADQLDRVLRIEQFRDVIRGAVDQLGAVSGALSTADLQAANAPTPAFAVEGELEWAIPELSRAADQADLVAYLTRMAMEVYGAAERAQNFAMHRLADQVGYLVGFTLPWLVVASAPVVVAAAAGSATGVAVASAVTGRSPDELMADLNTWLTRHPEVLNNDIVATTIDLITGAIDDAEAGIVHLPPGIAAQLGDGGLGITGVDTAAASIVAAGSGLGLLRESAISISSKLDKNAGQAPLTYAERLKLIPDTGSNGGAQIRIDKYFDNNGKLIGCDIYLSGTQAWDIRGTDTPFDLTSNVRATGNLSSGSLTAVEEAMAAAGIDKDTPVTLSGHSQGGIVAHEVAASGRYNVVGVLEAGTPAVHTSLQQGTPEIDLVHDEDIVPSLGGEREDNDAIVVSGTAYPEDDSGEKSDDTKDEEKKPNLVSAHDVDRYGTTAAKLDESDDPRVIAAAKALASTSAGATSMTSTLYTAERVTAK